MLTATVLAVSVVAPLLLLVLVLIKCLGCLRKQDGFKNFENEDSRMEARINPGFAMGQDIEETERPPLSTTAIQIEPLPELLSETTSRKPKITCVEKSRQESALKLVVVNNPYPFPRRQLKYLNEIGSGWFGQVLESDAEHITTGIPLSRVVAKVLKDDASNSEKKLFLEDVLPYRELEHDNVLRLLAQCTESTPYLMILEYAPLGDLKACAKKQQDRGNTDNYRLVKFARDAASGLACLHRHGYIHQDFAARNCVVMGDFKVKVGDYGISEDIYKSDYYETGNEMLPVRWMAPESLSQQSGVWQTAVVTREANIWSYGVLLWEMLNYGEQPYTNMSDTQVLQSVVEDRLMKLPEPSLNIQHRDRIFEVMQFCWLNPGERPSIEEAHGLLQQLINITSGAEQKQENFEKKWNQTIPSEARVVSAKPSKQTRRPASASFESDFSPIPTSEPAQQVLSPGFDELTSVKVESSLSTSIVNMPSDVSDDIAHLQTPFQPKLAGMMTSTPVMDPAQTKPDESDIMKKSNTSGSKTSRKIEEDFERVSVKTEKSPEHDKEKKVQDVSVAEMKEDSSSGFGSEEVKPDLPAEGAKSDPLADPFQNILADVKSSLPTVGAAQQDVPESKEESVADGLQNGLNLDTQMDVKKDKDVFSLDLINTLSNGEMSKESTENLNTEANVDLIDQGNTDILVQGNLDLGGNGTIDLGGQGDFISKSEHASDVSESSSDNKTDSSAKCDMQSAVLDSTKMAANLGKQTSFEITAETGSSQQPTVQSSNVDFLEMSRSSPNSLTKVSDNLVSSTFQQKDSLPSEIDVPQETDEPDSKTGDTKASDIIIENGSSGYETHSVDQSKSESNDANSTLGTDSSSDSAVCVSSPELADAPSSFEGSAPPSEKNDSHEQPKSAAEILEEADGANQIHLGESNMAAGSSAVAADRESTDSGQGQSVSVTESAPTDLNSAFEKLASQHNIGLEMFGSNEESAADDKFNEFGFENLATSKDIDLFDDFPSSDETKKSELPSVASFFTGVDIPEVPASSKVSSEAPESQDHEIEGNVSPQEPPVGKDSFKSNIVEHKTQSPEEQDTEPEIQSLESVESPSFESPNQIPDLSPEPTDALENQNIAEGDNSISQSIEILESENSLVESKEEVIAHSVADSFPFSIPTNLPEIEAKSLENDNSMSDVKASSQSVDFDVQESFVDITSISSDSVSQTVPSIEDQEPESFTLLTSSDLTEHAPTATDADGSVEVLDQKTKDGNMQLQSPNTKESVSETMKSSDDDGSKQEFEGILSPNIRTDNETKDALSDVEAETQKFPAAFGDDQSVLSQEPDFSVDVLTERKESQGSIPDSDVHQNVAGEDQPFENISQSANDVPTLESGMNDTLPEPPLAKTKETQRTFSMTEPNKVLNMFDDILYSEDTEPPTTPSELKDHFDLGFTPQTPDSNQTKDLFDSRNLQANDKETNSDTLEATDEIDAMDIQTLNFLAASPENNQWTQQMSDDETEDVSDSGKDAIKDDYIPPSLDLFRPPTELIKSRQTVTEQAVDFMDDPLKSTEDANLLSVPVTESIIEPEESSSNLLCQPLVESSLVQPFDELLKAEPRADSSMADDITCVTTESELKTSSEQQVEASESTTDHDVTVGNGSGDQTFEFIDDRNIDSTEFGQTTEFVSLSGAVTTESNDLLGTSESKQDALVLSDSNSIVDKSDDSGQNFTEVDSTIPDQSGFTGEGFIIPAASVPNTDINFFDQVSVKQPESKTDSGSPLDFISGDLKDNSFQTSEKTAGPIPVPDGEPLTTSADLVDNLQSEQTFDTDSMDITSETTPDSSPDSEWAPLSTPSDLINKDNKEFKRAFDSDSLPETPNDTSPVQELEPLTTPSEPVDTRHTIDEQKAESVPEWEPLATLPGQDTEGHGPELEEAKDTEILVPPAEESSSPSPVTDWEPLTTPSNPLDRELPTEKQEPKLEGADNSLNNETLLTPAEEPSSPSPVQEWEPLATLSGRDIEGHEPKLEEAKDTDILLTPAEESSSPSPVTDSEPLATLSGQDTEGHEPKLEEAKDTEILLTPAEESSSPSPVTDSEPLATLSGQDTEGHEPKLEEAKDNETLLTPAEESSGSSPVPEWEPLTTLSGQDTEGHKPELEEAKDNETLLTPAEEFSGSSPVPEWEPIATLSGQETEGHEPKLEEAKDNETLLTPAEEFSGSSPVPEWEPIATLSGQETEGHEPKLEEAKNIETLLTPAEESSGSSPVPEWEPIATLSEQDTEGHEPELEEAKNTETLLTPAEESSGSSPVPELEPIATLSEQDTEGHEPKLEEAKDNETLLTPAEESSGSSPVPEWEPIATVSGQETEGHEPKLEEAKNNETLLTPAEESSGSSPVPEWEPIATLSEQDTEGHEPKLEEAKDNETLLTPAEESSGSSPVPEWEPLATLSGQDTEGHKPELEEANHSLNNETLLTPAEESSGSSPVPEWEPIATLSGQDTEGHEPKLEEAKDNETLLTPAEESSGSSPVPEWEPIATLSEQDTEGHEPKLEEAKNNETLLTPAEESSGSSPVPEWEPIATLSEQDTEGHEPKLEEAKDNETLLTPAEESSGSSPVSEWEPLATLSGQDTEGHKPELEEANHSLNNETLRTPAEESSSPSPVPEWEPLSASSSLIGGSNETQSLDPAEEKNIKDVVSSYSTVQEDQTDSSFSEKKEIPDASDSLLDDFVKVNPDESFTDKANSEENANTDIISQNTANDEKFKTSGSGSSDENSFLMVDEQQVQKSLSNESFSDISDGFKDAPNQSIDFPDSSMTDSQESAVFLDLSDNDKSQINATDVDELGLVDTKETDVPRKGSILDSEIPESAQTTTSAGGLFESTTQSDNLKSHDRQSVSADGLVDFNADVEGKLTEVPKKDQLLDNETARTDSLSDFDSVQRKGSILDSEIQESTGNIFATGSLDTESQVQETEVPRKSSLLDLDVNEPQESSSPFTGGLMDLESSSERKDSSQDVDVPRKGSILDMDVPEPKGIIAESTAGLLDFDNIERKRSIHDPDNTESNVDTFGGGLLDFSTSMPVEDTEVPRKGSILDLDVPEPRENISVPLALSDIESVQRKGSILDSDVPDTDEKVIVGGLLDFDSGVQGLEDAAVPRKESILDLAEPEPQDIASGGLLDLGSENQVKVLVDDAAVPRKGSILDFDVPEPQGTIFAPEVTVIDSVERKGSILDFDNAETDVVTSAGGLVGSEGPEVQRKDSLLELGVPESNHKTQSSVEGLLDFSSGVERKDSLLDIPDTFGNNSSEEGLLVTDSNVQSIDPAGLLDFGLQNQTDGEQLDSLMTAVDSSSLSTHPIEMKQVAESEGDPFGIGQTDAVPGQSFTSVNPLDSLQGQTEVDIFGLGDVQPDQIQTSHNVQSSTAEVDLFGETGVEPIQTKVSPQSQTQVNPFGILGTDLEQIQTSGNSLQSQLDNDPFSIDGNKLQTGPSLSSDSNFLFDFSASDSTQNPSQIPESSDPSQDMFGGLLDLSSSAPVDTQPQGDQSKLLDIFGSQDTSADHHSSKKGDPATSSVDLL